MGELTDPSVNTDSLVLKEKKRYQKQGAVGFILSVTTTLGYFYYAPMLA
jgi:hypothetical protein